MANTNSRYDIDQVIDKVKKKVCGEYDMDDTQTNMDYALTRMDKLLKTNNRCQTWTILSLILISMVMFIFIVNSI